MLTDIDKDREKYRKQQELLSALQRLQTNSDFKKVILQGFCVDEVIQLNRYASNEQTFEAKQAAVLKAQAGPVLEAYFTRIENDGALARDYIIQLDNIEAEEA